MEPHHQERPQPWRPNPEDIIIIDPEDIIIIEDDVVKEEELREEELKEEELKEEELMESMDGNQMMDSLEDQRIRLLLHVWNNALATEQSLIHQLSANQDEIEEIIDAATRYFPQVQLHYYY